MDTIKKIRFELNKKAQQIVERRLAGLESRDRSSMSEDQIEQLDAQIAMLNTKKEKHAAACLACVNEDES